MSEVLIVSDSHGLTEELKTIQERHPIKWMIHCGDSELDFDAPELEQFYKVTGNCDFDVRYPEEQTIEIDGLKFYISHGHLHNVKMDLMGLSYRAEEEQAQVICFGHTHIAGAEKVDNKLYINPGSIRQPRNRVEKTYAIMSWNDRNAVTIQFYTVDGVKVEDLVYHTSL